MTPAQSVETLLPCPFCGAEPERCQNTDPSLANWMFWVLCKSCHASPGDRKSRAEADAAWNTRLQSIPEPLLDEGLVLAIELIERTPIGDLGSNRKPTRSWEQKRDDANMALATLRALSIPRLEAGRVTDIDKAVDGLIALHRRLLACFQSPTGQARPRRPKMLEPTMADRDVALNAAVVLERIKATINSTPDSNALREALEFSRTKFVQLSAGALANGNEPASKKIDGFIDRIDAALLSSDPGRVE